MATKITNSKDLRAKATADVEAWKTNKSAHAAAAAHRSDENQRIERAAGESSRGKTLDQSITVVTNDIAEREASHVAMLAEREASIALDAAERAEGHAHAQACDPARLQAELGAAQDDVERLERELAEARKRSDAILIATRLSMAAWSSERKTAGLPLPGHLPGLGSTMVTIGSPMVTAKDIIKGIARYLQEGPAMPAEDTRLPFLRREEAELRESRELARREVEERKKNEEADARRVEAERAQHAQRQQKESASQQAEVEAKAQKRRELIEADRARGVTP